MMKNQNDNQADFSIKLLQQTQLKETKSMVLSPLLIGISLAAFSNLIDDAAAEQLADILVKCDSKEVLNEYYANCWKALQKLKIPAFNLNVVNQMFIKNDIKIKEDFVNSITKLYNDDFVQHLNIRNNYYEDARNSINKSVKTATNNMIKEIVPEDIINSVTQILLVNSIFFYGEWKNPFFAEGQVAWAQKFYVTKKILRCVFYMEMYEILLYEATDDYEVLGLEYTTDCTMFIILPKEKFGLLF